MIWGRLLAKIPKHSPMDAVSFRNKQDIFVKCNQPEQKNFTLLNSYHLLRMAEKEKHLDIPI